MKIIHEERVIPKSYTEPHETLRRYSDKIFEKYYTEFFFANCTAQWSFSPWVNDGNITRLTERELVMYGRVDIWKHLTGEPIKLTTYRPDELYCVNYKQHEPEYVDDTWNSRIKHNFELLYLHHLNLSNTTIHIDTLQKNDLNIFYLLEFETNRFNENKIRRLEEFASITRFILKPIFIFSGEIPEIDKPNWIDFISISDIIK